MGAVTTRVRCRGAEEMEDIPLDAVSRFARVADTWLWIDMCDPSPAQLDELAGQLGLHHLAVEDVIEPHQRPKLDHYATHLFLSCHDVRLDREAGQLDKTEIDVFIGEGWLVTVRADDRWSTRPVVERWESTEEIEAHGVSYLLYGLLDAVVDGYFDAVESFDEYYDEVSEGIFADTPLAPSDQKHWFEMRRALVRFHRLVVPMREAISALMRHDSAFVDPEMRPYYQDVYDHILRVSESSESLRDLVSTIVETNLGLRDYRQNQIMKKVTSWAAIIALPTLVTGYYGMNVPFPGSGTTGGAITASALTVVLVVALILGFRRREWL